MAKVNILKGFKDILPGESEQWEWIDAVARETFTSFGFLPIRTPILEKSELFRRSIGETTDIVEKEMYTFQDWDGKDITLRPEGTASVVRAYLNHRSPNTPTPAKFYYCGPMFRHERPQAGRLRQFHQIGAEIIGDINPKQDAELLSLLHHFFEKLGISQVKLEINSLGCPNCRPAYRVALQSYFEKSLTTLCEDCQRRYTRNPLRILDCKKDICKEITRDAPSTCKYLCLECTRHFEEVQAKLRLLQIPHEICPHLVRGLDYYTKTAFEMTALNLGAQNAVAAGGRYDGLIKTLGGGITPAIGFAIGMERLIQLLDTTRREKTPLRIFLIPLGQEADGLFFPLLFEIRKNRVRSEMGNSEISLKRQLKQADRLGSQYVLIVGDREIEAGKAVLRNMKTKEQVEIALPIKGDKLLTQIG
ncbi:MAG: histidine--tRNA ligase [Nitrospiria bacterium]